MLFFPIQFDVPMARWPIANFAIIIFTLMISFMAFGGSLSESTIDRMILDGWNPIGMLGSMLLHGDLGL